LAGSQRVAFRVIKSGQTDKVFYLLADHLGSTNVVMQVGGVVETKTYTAWGKDRTGSINKTDRQYTGQMMPARPARFTTSTTAINGAFKSEIALRTTDKNRSYFSIGSGFVIAEWVISV